MRWADRDFAVAAKACAGSVVTGQLGRGFDYFYSYFFKNQ
jgi:hypothetical protein